MIPVPPVQPEYRVRKISIASKDAHKVKENGYDAAKDEGQKHKRDERERPEGSPFAHDLDMDA